MLAARAIAAVELRSAGDAAIEFAPTGEGIRIGRAALDALVLAVISANHDLVAGLGPAGRPPIGHAVDRMRGLDYLGDLAVRGGIRLRS